MSAGTGMSEKRQPRRSLLIVPLGLALAGLVGARATAREEWDDVERVVAVGDVHGDLAQLETVLRDASVIDGKERWIGGRTHLVQTGDRLDRGPDSRKVMDLMMRLEKEARKAGGAVHALIGNHEAMNVLGDLRYTTPAEFAAFRSPDSARLRDALFSRVVAERQAQKLPALTDAERRAWEEAHPPGFVEQRLALSPKGTYGAWICGLNAVIRIGDTLFVHGGISPKYADFSLGDLNERIRQELREADPLTAVITNDADGPLWFRGLSQGDPGLAGHLETVLKRHACRRMVVSHTPTEGLIMPLYGGRLVVIDVGLSRSFGGPPAGLILENGKAFALHRGRKLALPESDGEPLVRYVREVMALEPDPSRLQVLLDRLEGVSATGSPR
jgi:hypothetical protein